MKIKPTIDLTDFLLNDLQVRPGLYLRNKSIIYLSQFVTGWMICMYKNGIDVESDSFFSNPGFYHWFQTKIHKAQTPSVYATIQEQCKDDEKIAFDKFMEYLTEYKNENILPAPIT